MARLLSLAKHSRPNTPSLFQVTRAKYHNDEDWKKLCKALNCLRGTRAEELRWSLTDLSQHPYSVGGLYAVHVDMRGHSGALFQSGGHTVIIK